jgi:uncharacterized protein (TIGR02246 family)
MNSRGHMAVLCVPGLLLVALCFNATLASHVRAESTCVETTKHHITELSERWSRALATGNPDELANLYTMDAVLLPMLSGGPHVGRTQIRSYFNAYLKRHPQGLINMRSIMVGCNMASDIGTYTYRLTGRRKGTREAIVGRYTTLYEFRDGQWLIAQQHSSGMPRAP